MGILFHFSDFKQIDSNMGRVLSGLNLMCINVYVKKPISYIELGDTTNTVLMCYYTCQSTVESLKKRTLEGANFSFWVAYNLFCETNGKLVLTNIQFFHICA